MPSPILDAPTRLKPNVIVAGHTHMYLKQRIPRPITALEGKMESWPSRGKDVLGVVLVANPVRSILEFQFLAI